MNSEFLYDYDEYEFQWTTEEAVDRLAQVARWAMDCDEDGSYVALEAVYLAAEALTEGGAAGPNILHRIGRIAGCTRHDCWDTRVANACLAVAHATELPEDSIGPVMGHC